MLHFSITQGYTELIYLIMFYEYSDASSKINFTNKTCHQYNQLPMIVIIHEITRFKPKHYIR